MSNAGRALISALNAGDFAAVDQYSDLSDLEIKIVNSHIHELFERAIKAENFKLFMALLKIPKVLVSGPEYCALRHSASAGLVEYVRELSRMPSANPNLLGRSGDTALLGAVKGGWAQKKALDIVRAILVLPKVKVNIKDADGRTALWHALKKGWFEVAEVLMDGGANPQVEDEEGISPLTLGLTAAGMPPTLFTRLLSYSGTNEEEEADQAAAIPQVDDEDDYTPAVQQRRADPFPQKPVAPPVSRTPNPPVQLDVQPKNDDDHDDQAAPLIRKVSTVVNDFATDEPPLQADTRTPAPKLAEDTADFFAVMEGQAIDDSLEKSYLFEASSDGRYRLHRKAVLAEIEVMIPQLGTNGDPFTPQDCNRVDPATGHTLWQTAAIQGQFLLLLKAMARHQRWPEPAHLLARTEDGRTLADYLEDQAQLSAVLNDNVWIQRPRLLAALMSSLPERRLRALAPLVARTNLLILQGA